MRALLAVACWCAALVPLVLPPPAAAAQDWNSDSALALARRAIERRERTASDTALRDYKAHAHGFLFFLGQFGEGLSEPPRLVKADQLELEVYWKAPQLSKQRIVGWRDRAELPTDINYHRDHLGIVQNNFGRVVRLGEGDEVRDVPHPLAPGGLALYDVALGDTVTLVLPQRAVRVAALRVRPKDFGRPRLVGTLYVDLETAELVRLTFNFTPRAYLDPQLEDVSIVLDNALWDGRFWLPYRQEVEIRRRATWLDIPVRGIIRGRWQIDGYVFNLGLADGWFAGEEIVAVPKAERDSFPWTEPLAGAIQDIAEPVRENDLQGVRAEVARIAGRRALSGLKAQRLGARGVSDLLHANRVEGLAAGAGVVWRVPGDGFEVRVLGSYGFADRRPKGALALTSGDGLELAGYRQVRDVGDAAVIAPLLNSIASQEFGADYGDYYLATGARAALRRGLGARGEWRLAVARERVDAMSLRAEPATGRFRPNPPLGDGSDFSVASLTLRRRSEGFAVRRDLAAEVTVEAGRRDAAVGYLRLAAAAHLLVPLGGTRLLARVQGGLAGDGLPPHRAFVLGGRGSLLGDPFRAWGGRQAALAQLEWRAPVPFVRMAAGPYARTPGTLTLAPYAAAGWAGRPVPGTPWQATPRRGPRVTLGLGLEWLGVFRLEAGYGVQSRRVRVAFDVTRDFWDIL
ncbi:MAG TPA: hypothetical protein VGQ25_12250 [Gemmatimonadales bacterium]|nr:hypothetical protein [Gemmatimonadales bacterium]